MSHLATRRFAILTAAAGLALSVAFTANAQTAKLTIKIASDSENPGSVVSPETQSPFRGDRAAVDVAILLDTSNSMDGLIGQAKKQLWSIVQQFADAKKAGKTPLLRVAVMEYGNSGLPAAEGYIRQVVPLTDNLDEVSQGLFGLKTNGGDEYCGQVIAEALKRLDWNKSPNNYKAIFIAGNEPFTQGSVDYRDSCKSAIQAGVVVNTIHCGDYQAGVSGQWHAGADLAEGEYFNINQDKAVPHIACPQDKILIELNAKLNRTYLWYGSKEVRSFNCANQMEQDENAGPGAAPMRCQVKASSAYSNSGRDLVDTADDDAKILSKVDEEELPDEMQKMSPEERKAHVAAKSKERAELKKEIAKVSEERDVYLAKARSELAEEEGNEDTLGAVVVEAVRKQLQSRDFEVK